MKKLTMTLCMLVMLLGGVPAALAVNYDFCPPGFDTSKSGAENLALMEATQQGILTQIDPAIMQERIKSSQGSSRPRTYYTLLGYYSSAGEQDLEFNILMSYSYNKTVIRNVDLTIRDSSLKVYVLRKDYLLYLVDYDPDSGFGNFYSNTVPNIILSDMVTVYQVNSPFVYQAEDSTTGEIGSYLLTNYDDDAFMYLVAFDIELNGVAHTLLFQVTNTPGLPIPAAAWLMGTGLTGLVALRRKVKKT